MNTEKNMMDRDAEIGKESFETLAEVFLKCAHELVLSLDRAGFKDDEKLDALAHKLVQSLSEATSDVVALAMESGHPDVLLYLLHASAEALRRAEE